jgi:hypothetical protein
MPRVIGAVRLGARERTIRREGVAESSRAKSSAAGPAREPVRPRRLARDGGGRGARGGAADDARDPEAAGELDPGNPLPQGFRGGRERRELGSAPETSLCAGAGSAGAAFRGRRVKGSGLDGARARDVDRRARPVTSAIVAVARPPKIASL